MNKILLEMYCLKIISFISLAETNKMGINVDQTEIYIHLYSGLPKRNRVARGVSLLFSKSFELKTTVWEALSENTMTHRC